MVNNINGKPYPKIKFSKSYLKLPENANGRLAILKLATRILLQYQGDWFIKYDTIARDGSVYLLPKEGAYILLVFEFSDLPDLSKGGIFTTLRRHTQSKYDYYKGMQGKFFEVEVNEAKI